MPKASSKTLAVVFGGINLGTDARTLKISIPRNDNPGIDANTIEELFLASLIDAKLIPGKDVEGQSQIEGAENLKELKLEAECQTPGSRLKSWSVALKMHAIDDEDVVTLMHYQGKHGSVVIKRKGDVESKRGRKPAGDVEGQQKLGGDEPE